MLFGYFDLWAYYYMHYYYLFDCTARSKDVLACVLDWPIASWYFQLLLYFIVSHPSAFSLFIWSTCLTLHGSHCLPCWQKQREGESLHVEPACMEAAERKRESLHMRKLCLMCRFCTALFADWVHHLPATRKSPSGHWEGLQIMCELKNMKVKLCIKGCEINKHNTFST